ncbi:unnamed protein product [Cylicocyclus nassatus]|uniref:DNA endonuclease activator Ctp1 C-terminal domain-containing protein n=1 Tax=Cylicocyclus nassatus TaxID=53992 RepID=A0AA36H4E3_CYLNA|nr:unnamed protein product [Cylicocyclus nassatus]
MSFKRPTIESHRISSSSQPEVITLDDSDNEDTQDLFDSFPESKAGSPKKRKSVAPNPVRKHLTLSPFLKRESRNSDGWISSRKVRRSSSANVSPWKQVPPTVAYRRSTKSVNGDTISRKDPPVITLDDVSSKSIVCTRSPEKKPKPGLWTRNRLQEIARKFEERDQILSKLVREDDEFLDVVHGGAFDRVQKKAKESLKEGEIIRKQADRAKLLGVAHPTSEAYFDALQLSPQTKQQRIDEVSRYRVVAQKMPSTPRNYWEVGFPSESEQRRRGLIKEVHTNSHNCLSTMLAMCGCRKKVNLKRPPIYNDHKYQESKQFMVVGPQP